MTTDWADKRIAVLLSGGVDSSVVVYELSLIHISEPTRPY